MWPSIHWLYTRLNAHVGWSDEKVREAFAAYADENIVGGRSVLTDEHYAAILREHRDAQDLFRSFAF